jgi:hypothetical protein
MRLPNDGAAEITKLQTYEGVRKDSLFLGYIEGSDAPGRGHFPSYPEGGRGLGHFPPCHTQNVALGARGLGYLQSHSACGLLSSLYVDEGGHGQA